MVKKVVKKRGKVSSKSISKTEEAEIKPSRAKVQAIIKDGDYELVPENRFSKVEHDVALILENPIINSHNSKKLMILMDNVNHSLMTLLEVFKKISTETNFEEKEKNLIKNQMKPFVKVAKEIKDQNETIANAMVNIIDRLGNLELQVNQLKPEQNFVKQSFLNENVSSSLPPLEGGPVPEDVSNPVSMNQNVGEMPPPVSMDSNHPITNDSLDFGTSSNFDSVSQEMNSASMMPPALDMNSLDGNAIPPMENNALGKKKESKFSFFKK